MRTRITLTIVLSVLALLLLATGAYADSGGTHVVRAGETLNSIAAQHGVSATALALTLTADPLLRSRLVVVPTVLAMLATLHFRQRFALELGEAVARDMRDQLFAKLMHLPLAYFHRHRAGELISRATNDVQNAFPELLRVRQDAQAGLPHQVQTTTASASGCSLHFIRPPFREHLRTRGRKGSLEPPASRAGSATISSCGARRIVMEEVKTYRSPTRKLLQFFHRSRDDWKRKRQEAKVLIKRLSNRSRKLEASRNRWKELAKQYQQELRGVRAEAEAEKKAIA